MVMSFTVSKAKAWGKDAISRTMQAAAIAGFRISRSVRMVHSFAVGTLGESDQAVERVESAALAEWLSGALSIVTLADRRYLCLCESRRSGLENNGDLLYRL